MYLLLNSNSHISYNWMAGRGRKRAGSHVLRVADVKVVEEQSGRMCAKHAVNNVLQRIALQRLTSVPHYPPA